MHMKKIIKMPLCFHLSASQPALIQKKQATMYGGTERSCAVVLRYPRSAMIVGRNSAYEYLQSEELLETGDSILARARGPTHSGVYTPMVMNMCTQIFQSFIAAQKYFISNSSASEDRSSFSRMLTASRSG